MTERVIRPAPVANRVLVRLDRTLNISLLLTNKSEIVLGDTECRLLCNKSFIFFSRTVEVPFLLQKTRKIIAHIAVLWREEERLAIGGFCFRCMSCPRVSGCESIHGLRIFGVELHGL